ncbi:hypothetical protein [Chitinilyticum aquatile]|uniref:hypothetical protein n=1 Tax=Chitinilyticum aquatile TaxID=362520 RepID=UPI00048AE8D6|nr:hypothetical protein [Chitinilyticum aquatile]
MIHKTKKKMKLFRAIWPEVKGLLLRMTREEVLEVLNREKEMKMTPSVFDTYIKRIRKEEALQPEKIAKAVLHNVQVNSDEIAVMNDGVIVKDDIAQVPSEELKHHQSTGGLSHITPEAKERLIAAGLWTGEITTPDQIRFGKKIDLSVYSGPNKLLKKPTEDK